MILKHGTAQARFRGCAPVLNAGRAGSRPHSSQPAQLAGFPFWRRQLQSYRILMKFVGGHCNPIEVCAVQLKF